MAETKTFSLAQILTMTTGRLLCDMDGVYKILNFLTQDDIFTHAIPRAMRTCKPYLKELLPQFDTPEFQLAVGELIECLGSPAAKGHARPLIDGWLLKQIEVYGNAFELEPMPSEKWLHIDPMEELQEDFALAGKDPTNIITVNA